MALEEFFPRFFGSGFRLVMIYESCDDFHCPSCSVVSFHLVMLYDFIWYIVELWSYGILHALTTVLELSALYVDTQVFL